MCTLAAKKINNKFFIFKNRDLGWNAKTRIIKENKKVKKLLVVDERGHCEGLNEYGIGLIEATLKPYPLIRYPDSSKIARHILDQKNIKDAIEIIKNSKSSVNNIISDGKVAFIIEKTPYDFAFTKVINSGVITNLSIKLSEKNGSKNKETREASQIRYLRGKNLLKTTKNFNDIVKFLSDKKGYPLFSICRGKESISPTRCSYIYDLKNKTIFFCKARPDKEKFKKYQL
ncbi:MAG: carcinine hydrolase/isopenicillin-N N-acyltransferase family protein [Minisyncoccia bacterium]